MPPTDLCCHASSSFPHNPLFFNHVYSWAPFSSARSSFQQSSSFIFPSNIPSLNVLRVCSCRALGRQIKCWIHFFISFIYSLVQSAPHRARLVCVVVGWHAHFAWQKATRDTSEQLFLERWVLPARQAELPVLQCACACVSHSQKAIWTLLNSYLIFLRNRWTSAIISKFSTVSPFWCQCHLGTEL